MEKVILFCQCVFYSKSCSSSETLAGISAAPVACSCCVVYAHQYPQVHWPLGQVENVMVFAGFNLQKLLFLFLVRLLYENLF